MAWLETNSFHHADFSDLAKLCEAKRAAGLSISVCIPTLNEEATIGAVVGALRRGLLEGVPLIDEVVVIDSGSTDRTTDLARAEGAEVHFSGDILPGWGFRRGKGENLWKAVYQLRGDLICYVDADILNIHPRFVSGLVAPLLLHPSIQFVKGFYERPLADSDGLLRPGGGRVTEILVRPLFSLFFPALAQLYQPLAGEYAVRRSLLETLSFPTGYSVEITQLLDVFMRWGMDAFAQCDLEERVHRNQDTAALGLMSFSILQSFFKRLQSCGRLGDLGSFPRLHHLLRTTDSGCGIVSAEVDEDERPPMIEIPEYLARFPR